MTKLSYGSLYVDIDGNNRSVVSLRGDRGAEKAYVLNTGMMSSLYESTVLEELTGVESVSTVSRGIKIKKFKG